MRMLVTLEFADAGTRSGPHRVLIIDRNADNLHAGDIGLSLDEAKTLMNDIQEEFVSAQAAEIVEKRRQCGCGKKRNIKDWTLHRIHTALGASDPQGFSQGEHLIVGGCAAHKGRSTSCECPTRNQPLDLEATAGAPHTPNFRLPSARSGRSAEPPRMTKTQPTQRISAFSRPQLVVNATLGAGHALRRARALGTRVIAIIQP